MLFGTLSIKTADGGAVRLETHNDSYLLSRDMTISVRRPLASIGVILALAIGSFTLAFGGLLHMSEIITSVMICAAFIMAGLWLGELTLLNRDLKGSKLGSVIFGSYKRNGLIKNAAKSLRLFMRPVRQALYERAFAQAADYNPP